MFKLFFQDGGARHLCRFNMRTKEVPNILMSLGFFEGEAA